MYSWWSKYADHSFGHQVTVVGTPTHEPVKVVSYLSFSTFRPHNNANTTAEDAKEAVQHTSNTNIIAISRTVFPA